MPKVLITADLHFGLPKKLNDILWSVRTIREYAKQNDIEVVLVCGDIFHDRVNYNIEVLNAAYKFFEETRRMGQEWIAFPGNHDMPLRHTWDVNTLKPLNQVLTVIDDIKMLKIFGQRFWVVPFIHYESVYMKVLKKIEEQYEDGDVLLTHVGVNSATLNECFLIKHWSVVDFGESKFDRVFTGHFHCHQSVGERKNVWYPGSPIPFRFDEGMVPHGFIEFDLETQEIEFIKIFNLDLVSGKRPSDYITITDDMLEETDIEDFKGDNVRIQLNRDYSRDELLRIRKDLEDVGVQHIKLNKAKEEKIDLASGTKNNLSLYSPEEMFNQWLEHDAPKKLNIELLKKLNQEIVKSK
jgi:DNA repair exonuclease SbcCD nuclease subunit